MPADVIVAELGGKSQLVCVAVPDEEKDAVGVPEPGTAGENKQIMEIIKGRNPVRKARKARKASMVGSALELEPMQGSPNG